MILCVSLFESHNVDRWPYVCTGFTVFDTAKNKPHGKVNLIIIDDCMDGTYIYMYLNKIHSTSYEKISHILSHKYNNIHTLTKLSLLCFINILASGGVVTTEAIDKMADALTHGSTSIRPWVTSRSHNLLVERNRTIPSETVIHNSKDNWVRVRCKTKQKSTASLTGIVCHTANQFDAWVPDLPVDVQTA